MDKSVNNELLKLQLAELTEKTPFCPENREIAEYFDGDLAENRRLKLERHLADCRFCLARVGLLERLENSGGERRVPEVVLARAKQLTHTTPAQRQWKTPAWAAAAVIVFTLDTVIGRHQMSVPESDVRPVSLASIAEDSRTLRSVKPLLSEIQVINPSPGSAIQTGSLIRWAEVPDRLHYNIFVLSRAGDVLWTERLEGNEWAMYEVPQLAPDSPFYFRVEAQLPNGRTLTSKHMTYILTGQP
jgi:hypothetical protein